MIKAIAKRIASCLPTGLRQVVQRGWYTYRIRSGDFKHYEPEFDRMSSWVSPGDWVLDIGANLGIYSSRLSQLVGTNGRVFAFEPVPETFRFLIHNSRLFPFPNITFMNIAVSSECGVVQMHVPMTGAGIPASARASISEDSTGNGQAIVCMPLDQLDFPKRVTFVKIDVEGHELSVINGMLELIRRDRPRFVIEGFDEKIRDIMVGFGYQLEIIQDSPNSIFHPPAAPA